MKKIISSFNYFAVAPLIVMWAARFIPKGNDPRGYGLSFAVTMASFLISALLALLGGLLCIAARKMRLAVIPTLIATVVAAFPVVFLIVDVISGHV
jgi:hypothetical protein